MSCTAYSLIRQEPWYRRDAFAAGLAACGYQVRHGRPQLGRPGDVLLLWNRYGEYHDLALMFEARGGTVIIAENGYLGRGGSAPKFDVRKTPQPGHYYALALGGHNGQGWTPADDGARFRQLGVELKPWRETGEHILVCPNRSFGIPGRMMRHDWGEATARRLAQQQGRPVRLRPHPGNDAPQHVLADDLAGAWAVVIWSSSAGVHALAAGIPVICESPFWILKSAACTGLAEVDRGAQPARLAAFERLACAQWTLDEIATGAPFKQLLDHAAMGHKATA